MQPRQSLMLSTTVQSAAAVAAFLFLACSSDAGIPGSTSEGTSPSTGGASGGGSIVNHAGAPTFGGAGAATASGGAGGRGSAVGGAPGTAGAGVGTGGRTGGTGGARSFGGATGASGAPGAAGSSSSGAGAGPLDCNAVMPTGGTKHTGDSQGGKDNLAWQLWANSANNGSITTFSTPAFSADWNNAGDYLARLGYEWGNAGKTYDTYGTITAQYAYTKTGTGGGYSYIGIYGWSTNPCVEWYIVDDSFNGMPVNPGSTTNKGTVTIDGGDYILYTRQTTGTGGSRCNVSSWAQYYSVRKTARQCGTISITQHFDAWKAAGMPLGNMLEAKILVEVGGGNGSVDFPVANVTLSQ